MAEHGLDRLEVGAAGQGEGGSAVPEVVEPDRGQSLPAYKLGEPAGQVPGRVGTSARAGEDVPVAPRGQLLPAAVRGEDLQGPGIEGQDPVAGDALGRQQHQPAAGFLQLPADRQRGPGEVDVAPAQPGRLAPAQPGNRHELIAGIEGLAADRGEEPGSLPGVHTATAGRSPASRQAASRGAVQTTGCGRAGAGSSTSLAGLTEISPSRIAAFSAARSVARIRARVAGDSGPPAAGRWRAIAVNVMRRSAAVSIASGMPMHGRRYVSRWCW